jgi:ribosomal protein S18 acetylase RimI-like enzyme
MQVRRATLQDLEQIVQLFDQYRMFYGTPSDLPAARHFIGTRLRDGDCVIFLAEADRGIAAGFVQLFPGYSSVSLAPIYILNDLYVAPGQRRRGAARALLKAAQGYARTTDAARLMLATEVTNRPAQALYESMGWTRNEGFRHYELAL